MKRFSIVLPCFAMFTVLVSVSTAYAAQGEKQTSLGVVFVDQANGVDTESRVGDESEPFASISFALQMLNALESDLDWTIRINAGTYSATADNPEVFPLVLAPNMRLIGTDGPDEVIVSGLDNPNDDAPLVFGNGATGVVISGITFREQIRTGGSQRGGALELLEFGGAINDCRFENNRCAPRGGAIYLALAEGEACDLNSVEFLGNQAASGVNTLHEGGALYISGDYRGEISECTFTNNIVNASTNGGGFNGFGGAVYVGGDFTAARFENNRFVGNRALARGDIGHGGGLYVSGSMTASIRSCTFTDNDANEFDGNGGAIFVGDTFNGTMVSTTYLDNFAGWDGGAVYVGGSGSFSLTECNFRRNKAASGRNIHHRGGGICVVGDFEGAITDCEFVSNEVFSATNGGDFHGFGGAIYVGGNLKSDGFTGNRLEKNAAMATGDIGFGGALCVEGDLDATITASDFIENKANDFRGYGGSIYVGGGFVGGVSFGVFRSNFAGWRGGAVYVTENSSFSLSNSDFENNQVQSGFNLHHLGGAVCVEADLTGSITQCSFIGNTVSSVTNGGGINAYGGGLYVGGDLNATLFEGNYFEANQTFARGDVGYGGGVCVLGNFNAAINQCVFVNNDTDALDNQRDYNGFGGAVYVGASLTGGTSNSVYQDNYAGYGGGALFCNGNWVGPVAETGFLRNSIRSVSSVDHAFVFGGALAVGDAFIGDITSSLFSDNLIITSGRDPGNGGGVAVMGVFDGRVTNNVFTNNRVNTNSNSHGGALAIFGQIDPMTEFRANSFARNYGRTGGALYFAFDRNSSPLVVANNHFLYNVSSSGNDVGSSLHSRQNVDIFNNTFWGGGADLNAVRLEASASGGIFQNNLVAHIGTAINIGGEQSIPITYNNFFNTDNILVLNGTMHGNNPGAIADNVGNNPFNNNRTREPGIVGEGEASSMPELFNGHWTENAYYDSVSNRTVFTDADELWTPNELQGKFLDLSQQESNKEQYPIVGNSETEIFVAGNLVPDYPSIVADNRGGFGDLYYLDDYRLTAYSPLIDAGNLVANRSNDSDFEGDDRPMNCNVDIGADEGLLPIPGTITLLGPDTICVAVGGNFVDPGAMVLDASGVNISDRLVRSSDVNIAIPGTYSVEYRLEFCDEVTHAARRTVIVGGVDCESSGQIPPTANAGVDLVLVADNNGTVVQLLDGSASSDVDGTIASYVWRGLGNAPDPEDVVMPTVMLDLGTFQFELTVTDNDGNTDSDQVTIAVVDSSAGQAPVADAGVDQMHLVASGATIQVTLDGSGSRDADGTIDAYEWVGLNGAPNPADVDRPTLNLVAGTYEFSLTVTDNGGLTDSDTVQVFVEVDTTGQVPPMAVATATVTQAISGTNALATVRLDGSASSDANGTIVEYIWSNISGSPDPDDVATTTPMLVPGNYGFMLAVTDDEGLFDTASVFITVSRPDRATIRALLLNGFDSAAGGDGVMTFEEAQAVISYLAQDEFDAVGGDSDAALTREELEGASPVVTDPLSCAAGGYAGGAGGLSNLLVVLGVVLVLCRQIGASRVASADAGECS